MTELHSVADYPFTTLQPHLGVVKVGTHQSFVVADVPGLIEGAAQGAGLGIRFLKHLSRTKILLHVIDVLPSDGSDPKDNAMKIINELNTYSDELAHKEHWLVLNKIDLLTDEQRQDVQNDILNFLSWTGPVIEISALQRLNTDTLCEKLMDKINESKESTEPSP